MVIVYVLYVFSILLFFTGITLLYKFISIVRIWFLPTTSEVGFAVAILVVAIILIALGVGLFIKTIKREKRVKLKHEKHRVIRGSGEEAGSEDFNMLSQPSKSLSEAAGKVVAYCFSQNTFLKPELQEIADTLGSMSGLFKNIVAVMDRRFTGGLTASKYQQGIEALKQAVLVRVDNQIMQLCAVNEDDLRKKSKTDKDCEQSLQKLVIYLKDTQLLLNKTVGLVSRLALEAMDCSNDELEREAGNIYELVSELKEYK